jgi:hypothetical protein
VSRLPVTTEDWLRRWIHVDPTMADPDAGRVLVVVTAVVPPIEVPGCIANAVLSPTGDSLLSPTGDVVIYA